MTSKLLEPLIVSKEEGGKDVIILEYPSRKRISPRVINDVDGFQEVSFKSQEDAREIFQRIGRKIEKDDKLILIRAKLGDIGKMRGDDAEWDLDEILAGRKGDLTLERALQGRGDIQLVLGKYLPRKNEWIQITMNYRLNIAGVSSGKAIIEINKEEKKLKSMLEKVMKLLKDDKVADALKELSKINHLIANPETQLGIERVFQMEDARKSRLLKWIELIEDYEEDKEEEYRESSENIREILSDILGFGKSLSKISGGFLIKAFEDFYGTGSGRRETRESIIEDFLKRTGRRTIQKRYIPEDLTLEDLKKQLKSIEEGTPRPQLKSFKSRESEWTRKAKEVFGDERSKEDIVKFLSPDNTRKQKRLLKGFDEIYDRGMKAYETSGSRPNQTPFSWGQARVYGVLFGSPARNQDADIVNKFNIPLVK
jgi:acetolactate synthase small subunit